METVIWYNFSDAIIVGILILSGILTGYGIRGLLGRWRAEAVENQAKLRLQAVEAEIEAIKKDADIQARDYVIKAKEDFEASLNLRRKELQKYSESLDDRSGLLNKKEDVLNRRIEDVQKSEQNLHEKEKTFEKRELAANEQLQKLAMLTSEDARHILYKRAENETKNEIGSMILRLQEEAKASAERDAKRLVATAMQRYSVSHASELMTTTIPLQSEEIKGRIIGKEGRNIRSLESLTGVSILVDEAPDFIVLSSFDPIRREIARRTLLSLIDDGRIHPGSIEESYRKAEAQFENSIQQIGEEACTEAGVTGVDISLVRLIGRLNFRTSFSQNVLRHSIEVANLMGLIAPELGLSPMTARRIGLFHDIGKTIDQENEGPHALVGAERLKVAGEPEIVVNAVAAHHDDEPAISLYAIICQTADAISSSRPGARETATEMYMKRLGNLERIATSFKGILRAFAIQAGRELRIIVQPDEVSDSDAIVLARDVARKIQTEMQYPGQIKVIVSRETRFVTYAR